ncbi:MAG: arylsulfatase [Cytophagales bacterium]|nr:arylsulfatase [Cytophagales bacterium]
MKIFLPVLISLCLFLVGCGASENSKNSDSAKKPNVVIIYVDDLGYADVGAYGALGVPTPNVDRLAQNGIKFTDGHCSAATCTPSRYSLLTGSYAFRNKAQVLPGNAPLIITEDTRTLGNLFQDAGYKTAVVGKWHLGLGDGNVDWNGKIAPGPLERGFDYSFLIPATGDRVPCVYVENHTVVGLDKNDPITVSYDKPINDEPTGISHPEMLKQLADEQHSRTIVDSVSRIGYMTGGKAALWKDEEFPDVLATKAKQFIAENKEDPFFLFFSFHDIHVPRIPNKRFVGKSTMGPRGDAIFQMDWVTGQLMEALENHGLAENTLVIFSSDNGPVLDDGYADQAVELLGEHKPAGPFRGAKYSAYEAGTRVPTIAYWPSTIKPGESDALVSQIDLFASLAKLVGAELGSTDAPDSYDMLETWLGNSKVGREYLIEESITLSLRYGDWKYIRPASLSLDWTAYKNIESGISESPQLYDLQVDRGEQNNLAEEREAQVTQMEKKLEAMVTAKGTRPGYE